VLFSPDESYQARDTPVALEGCCNCAWLPDLRGRAHVRREPEQGQDMGGSAAAQVGCGWAGGGCLQFGSVLLVVL